MKKNIFAIIAFFALTLTIVPLCSFTNPSTVETESYSTSSDAIYWQGWAKCGAAGNLYITVYQSPNACNAYYAVATKLQENTMKGYYKEHEINETLVVKQKSNGDYYVTYDGLDYRFSM